MKKLISIIISALTVFACTFSFIGCVEQGDNGGDNTHTKHNWSATYTPDDTRDQHYQTCDGCDEKQYGDHDYGTSGTCVCGKTKTAGEHTKHNWSTTYTPDGDRHYQTCDGCDEKQYGDHDYGTSGTCVCGKTKPETDVPAESVSLDKTDIELEVGSAGTKLTATVLPENATDKTVTYSVAPAGIVSVDEGGNVTAISDGTAVITATTSNGKTATCNVTVTKPLTNAEVLEFLNENVLVEAAKSALPSTATVNESTIKNATWYLTKEGDNVKSANLVFIGIIDDTFYYLILCKVDFVTPLTPQNIKDGEIGSPTYSRIYRQAINPTIQDEHADLTNAICDKLFGAKEDAARYIIDNGRNDLDSKLGDARYFTVIEVRDNGIIEEEISISYVSTDNGLIEKLNNENNFYTSNEKSYSIIGIKLENNNEKF